MTERQPQPGGTMPWRLLQHLVEYHDLRITDDEGV